MKEGERWDTGVINGDGRCNEVDDLIAACGDVGTTDCRGDVLMLKLGTGEGGIAGVHIRAAARGRASINWRRREGATAMRKEMLIVADLRHGRYVVRRELLNCSKV